MFQEYQRWLLENAKAAERWGVQRAKAAGRINP